MLSDEVTQLAATVGVRARELRMRIAVAESLTGGMLASALVAVPGASHFFAGGVVAYDTPLKHSLLGVDADRLREIGPVDEEVAKQMAVGVRNVCTASLEPGVDALQVDLGIATTGVAGPEVDPQTGLKPGTVWLGVSSGNGERAVLLRLDGDRQYIREAVVGAALREILTEFSRL